MVPIHSHGLYYYVYLYVCTGIYILFLRESVRIGVRDKAQTTKLVIVARKSPSAHSLVKLMSQPSLGDVSYSNPIPRPNSRRIKAATGHDFHPKTYPSTDILFKLLNVKDIFKPRYFSIYSDKTLCFSIQFITYYVLSVIFVSHDYAYRFFDSRYHGAPATKDKKNIFHIPM